MEESVTSLGPPLQKKEDRKEETTCTLPPPPVPKKAEVPTFAAPPPRKPANIAVGVGQGGTSATAVVVTPVPAAPAPAVYEMPEWSGTPSAKDFPYTLEVLKTGTIVDTIDLAGRELFMIGKMADKCDYTLEHPSISRQHVAIQFKADGVAYIYDLSTHGTRVNKRQLRSRVYAKLSVGDVIQLGQSSRLLIFQGPEELMQAREGGWGFKTRPDEVAAPSVDEMASAKAKALQLKLQRDKEKREGLDAAAVDGHTALLARQAEGASWGFGDDASDDDEEETSDAVSEARRLKDEGKLTEKQEQLLEKLEKRLAKIQNLREEIRRIKVKQEAGSGGAEKEVSTPSLERSHAPSQSKHEHLPCDARRATPQPASHCSTRQQTTTHCNTLQQSRDIRVQLPMHASPPPPFPPIIPEQKLIHVQKIQVEPNYFVAESGGFKH